MAASPRKGHNGLTNDSLVFGQKVEVATVDPQEVPADGGAASQSPSKPKKVWARAYLSHSHAKSGGTTVAVRYADGVLREHVPLGLVRRALPAAPDAAAAAQFDDPFWSVGDHVRLNRAVNAASPRKRRRGVGGTDQEDELVQGVVVQRYTDTWCPSYDVKFGTGESASDDGSAHIVTRVKGSDLVAVARPEGSSTSVAETDGFSTDGEAPESGSSPASGPRGVAVLEAFKQRAAETKFSVNLEELANEEPEGAEYLSKLRALVATIADIHSWDQNDPQGVSLHLRDILELVVPQPSHTTVLYCVTVATGGLGSDSLCCCVSSAVYVR